MELISIIQARTVGLFEVQALDPRGRVSTFESIQLLTEYFSFAQGPKSIGDLNIQKGIDFVGGKLGEVNIEKLSLFENGVVVDTRSSTADSHAVIEALITFSNERLGATVRPNRWMRLSQLSFRSSINFSKLTTALDYLSTEIGRLVTRDYGQEILFLPFALHLSADHSQTNLQPARFVIERRAETPFKENIYFSAAPVDTDKHIELIQYLESQL